MANSKEFVWASVRGQYLSKQRFEFIWESAIKLIEKNFTAYNTTSLPCTGCLHLDRLTCVLGVGNHCIRRAEDYFTRQA